MCFEFSTEVFAWLEDEAPRLCTESEQKHELIHLYFHFFDAFFHDFDTAQSTLLQAIQLAEELSEFSWGLFLRRNLLLFWLHYDLLSLALLESFSLLSLLADERLHGSLHLPYACHDIVACYSLLDPVGYYKEIIANSQEVLSQDSVPDAVATAAYRHLMLASAASHFLRETEHWVAVLQSYSDSSDFACDFGLAYERLELWPQAKLYYLDAATHTSSNAYLLPTHCKALLGAARSHCALHEVAETECLLSCVLPLLSTLSCSLLLARLFEVEAHLALADNLPERAVSFFSQAAYIYLEFALHRDAVLSALQAAELARSAHLSDSAHALSLASQAARMLPSLTPDLVQRFTAFSCQLFPSSSALLLSPQSVTYKQLRDRELAVLKSSLRISLACVHPPLVSLLLLLLAHAHLKLESDFHLAVSYLVWHIILEYTYRSSLPLDDSVALLIRLRNEHEPTLVDGILRALLVSPPPGWLTQLSEELSAKRLQTLLRSLLHFLSATCSSSLLQDILMDRR